MQARLLLIGWPLIVPLLVYLPINVQRRLAEAVIVPLAILAVYGIAALAQRWPRGRLIALTLFATLPTSLLLLAGAYATALNTASPQVFYPTAQIETLHWLDWAALPGEVVLSSHASGNLIPAYTNLRAYLGHGPETLYANRKVEEVAQFFTGTLPDADRRALLDRVQYVFVGPPEHDLAEGNTSWQAGLRLIHEDGDYAIYGVAKGDSP